MFGQICNLVCSSPPDSVMRLSKYALGHIHRKMSVKCAGWTNWSKITHRLCLWGKHLWKRSICVCVCVFARERQLTSPLKTESCLCLNLVGIRINSATLSSVLLVAKPWLALFPSTLNILQKYSTRRYLRVQGYPDYKDTRHVSELIPSLIKPHTLLTITSYWHTAVKVCGYFCIKSKMNPANIVVANRVLLPETVLVSQILAAEPHRNIEFSGINYRWIT